MLSCVEDVRREIGRLRQEQRPASRHGRPQSAGAISNGGALDLDEEGRQLLMEKLLSQEEVMRLLYEKAFNRGGVPSLSSGGPRHNSFVGLSAGPSSRPTTPGGDRGPSAEPGPMGGYMGGGAGGGLSAVRATRPSSAPPRKQVGTSGGVPGVYGQISLEDEMLAAGGGAAHGGRP